jgi:hypothetical protein
VGLRAGLDAEAREKILCRAGDRTPIQSTMSLAIVDNTVVCRVSIKEIIYCNIVWNKPIFQYKRTHSVIADDITMYIYTYTQEVVWRLCRGTAFLLCAIAESVAGGQLQ